MAPVTEFADSDSIAGKVEPALDELEKRLISMVRDAAHGAVPVDQAISLLGQFVDESRTHFRTLRDIEGQRDLLFDAAMKLESLAKRVLWLYRKCGLESIFFSKLRVERRLRDDLFKYVLEAYQQVSDLEEEERTLRGLSEDSLARRLLNDTETLTSQ